MLSPLGAPGSSLACRRSGQEGRNKAFPWERQAPAWHANKPNNPPPHPASPDTPSTHQPRQRARGTTRLALSNAQPFSLQPNALPRWSVAVPGRDPSQGAHGSSPAIKRRGMAGPTDAFPPGSARLQPGMRTNPTTRRPAQRHQTPVQRTSRASTPEALRASLHPTPNPFHSSPAPCHAGAWRSWEPHQVTLAWPLGLGRGRASGRGRGWCG